MMMFLPPPQRSIVRDVNVISQQRSQLAVLAQVHLAGSTVVAAATAVAV